MRLGNLYIYGIEKKIQRKYTIIYLDEYKNDYSIHEFRKQKTF